MVNFARFFFKLIFKKRLSFENFSEFDPEHYQGLTELLDSKRSEDFELSFSYYRADLKKEVELVKQGKEIAVNENNK